MAQALRDSWLLLGQGLLLARAPHLVRWRLETFGVYMPSLVGTRPWWRMNLRAVLALLRQLPAYMHWLGQMEAIRRGGGPGWWHREHGTSRVPWVAWCVQEDESWRNHRP